MSPLPGKEPRVTDIRPYASDRDADAAFALWQESIGKRWPLSAARFHAIIGDPCAASHWVAVDGEHIIGFAALHDHQTMAGEREATLTALVVAPDMRRRGIGTALHDAALDALRERGVRHVSLGAGDVHFWEGVPDDCPEALSFFPARGWTFTERAYDLVRDVRDFRTSSDLAARVGDAVRFGVATTAGDVADLFAFVAREFPSWVAEYEAIRASGAWQEFLIGRDTAGAVVASLIIFTPQSDQMRGDKTWSLLLGDDMGALGCVGVAKVERGKGYGLALVARGMEIVRERGGRNCHIHWTGVPGFYKRLGFRIWTSFAMSHREL
jgi:GNAT superfamily N-acetyltransferase